MSVEKIDTLQDYVHIFKTDLDTVTLRNSCQAMAIYAQKMWGHLAGTYADENAPAATRIYAHYNALLHPYAGFGAVYAAIRDGFNLTKAPEDKGTYWAQVWINVYRKGEFVNWHGHCPHLRTARHGFICVNSGDSKTTYRIQEDSTTCVSEYDVVSEDGLMVISRSDKDTHRTYPWEDDVNPRITIAFDIVPEWDIQSNIVGNHWIPLV